MLTTTNINVHFPVRCSKNLTRLFSANMSTICTHSIIYNAGASVLLFSFVRSAYCTHCLSFLFLITHSKNVYSQKSLCYCPTAGSQKRKKDNAQGTFCLSFLVWKLHGRQTMEHLSGAAAWPLIIKHTLFYTQYGTVLFMRYSTSSDRTVCPP